jgi:hypothetical protein
MIATTTQCNHGWTLDYLQQSEQVQIALVAAWQSGYPHPFRAEGLKGAQLALASVRAHIAEVKQG